ncbi:MAG: hypothetical protein AVO39_08775 [delta proteobacterium MLS_D]|nr:MAG: hypothetical protein AVO39_08775 [delta proteobacterium MLS_D]
MSERFQIVPVVKFDDYEGGKQTAGLYVGTAHTVTFVILTAGITTAGARVTVEYGTDEAAAVGTMGAVNRAFRTTADIEAAAADTLTAVDYETDENYWKMTDDDDRMWVIEVDVAAVPSGNAWIALNFGSQASALNLTGVAIVETRYKPSGSLLKE